MAVTGANAILSWKNSAGQLQARFLRVTDLAQAHTLSGQQAQSHRTRHFYPRAYAPGDLSVTAQSISNDEFKDLAQFIRLHHLMMMSLSGAFAVNDPSDAKYTRLMRFFMASEGFDIRGWIKNFEYTNKGVADPFPQMTFDFTVAFDAHSVKPSVSRTIKDWNAVIRKADLKFPAKKPAKLS